MNWSLHRAHMCGGKFLGQRMRGGLLVSGSVSRVSSIYFAVIPALLSNRVNREWKYLTTLYGLLYAHLTREPCINVGPNGG